MIQRHKTQTKFFPAIKGALSPVYGRSPSRCCWSLLAACRRRSSRICVSSGLLKITPAKRRSGRIQKALEHVERAGLLLVHYSASLHSHHLIETAEAAERRAAAATASAASDAMH